jgi:hypothetical protein
MKKNELPDQFLYSRKGPWPQPSPSHPLICADEVLHIPPIEALLFNEAIGARYLKDQIGYAAPAAAYAVSVAEWKGVSVDRFDEIMVKTLYSRFRVPMTEGQGSEREACELAFQDDPAIMAELKSGTWYKYDFSAMDLIDPLEEMYCSATKAFFRIDETGAHSCRIIEVGGLHVYRTDNSFHIAMLYALQGASYHVLFVVHPALHFPMDSVNAITKTSIPMGHPLFQLFVPHSVYTLPLDNAVLESSNTVVNNNAQGTRFDPLTANAYNLKLLFGAGYNGLSESHGRKYDPVAYPRFDYMNPQLYDKDRRPEFDSDYGKWLAAYFNEAFLPFCKTVANYIKADTTLLSYVENWARYCSNHVHGFPTKTEISTRDPADETLARALAIFIWNASVAHGGDHWSFANQITAVEKCLRIRRKPPVTRNEEPVDNADKRHGMRIFSPNDMQRAALGQYMFFQAWAIEPNLYETMYAFTEPELLAASTQFNDALLSVNEKMCHHVKPKPGSPDTGTNCQPLVPFANPNWQKPGDPTSGIQYLVPFERTIPQSIQY